MLTQAQQAQRENRITASQVGILMSGDEEKILGLWRYMLGLEEATDLSHIWAVRRGEATEQLNLDWYEYKTGKKVTRRGEVVVMPTVNWACCTLDGFAEWGVYPIECKDVGGRESIETIIGRYQPQCHWQMLCTSTRLCALSVIMGGNEPIVEMIERDDAYAKQLMARASSFMLCLETLTAPCAAPPIAPPVQQIRRYDMSDSEEWMAMAPRWIQAEGAARTAKEAEKVLKSLMPDDASAAYGGGVIITRDRAGRMSLRRGE